MKLKSAIFGITGGLALLGIYFLITGLISGPAFAFSQFKTYWYFIVLLSGGFGIQVGLYMYIKETVKNAGRMVAATGGTSTLAMISCCSHYLVNVLPLLGATAFLSLIAQYQIQIFWVAIAFNLFGIFIMSKRLESIK
ncbi:MAG: hypothetical protein A3C27_02180 [Candidatus Levybacteria bacterium RIFCSPHIGHO2_02_FULL_39_36]|nr:MAG: hypothetical protein UT20_C0007G0009 [Candidatus Levybacteria bacterium GW2011_GWA1_39_11]OGH15266.1 MAG: hypothetical protein A2689_00600 [Candidatus Levybacteria bacterium RIFCSPHIGHO2_01_FULL_38_96]OGH25414.1 MAG: hypothetical protein A3E68_02900 [Candidatus Levybacteria bacterium RIFCSPHIGHO2_12_FULL_39_39]OGH28127.1 MAG: hypothetical protein A3C27_02180 [Candidatus Levybacteria bacterium RIFCSPHIGHO2_02_FULL_39_36]OGH36173.1 MAG: hypothetical protein A3B43_01990 [Candidatus Levybac